MDNELKEMLEGLKTDILESMDSKLDEKLKGIKEEIQIINYKLDISNKKIDDLDLRVRISESNIRKDIKKLSDENETMIEVLKQHELLPR